MRWLAAAVVAAVTVGVVGGGAFASSHALVLDPALGEFPEGIAVGRDGALYVSLAPRGEIRRFDDAGATTYFTIDPGTTGLGILGLARDRRGTLYAAVPSDAPAAHGVWAIEPDGAARRLPASEQIVFPNGIALGQHDELYVTDSISGAIWRIDARGTELWLQHESLEGLAVLNPFPLGANGITYAHGRLLVANTERKQVVAVPIERSGAAGTPEVLHEFLGDADFLDGIAVDVGGNLYVCVAGRNEIVRIRSSGDRETVATAGDGLSVPASLAFGGHGTAKRTLYVTNLSLPGLAPVPMPSVVALPVPLPGPPSS